MPIRSYAQGERYPITLPGDEENPTIFWVDPLTSRGKDMFETLEGHAGRMILRAFNDATVDRSVEAVDAKHDAGCLFLTSRVGPIENAYRGDTCVGMIEKPEEINSYLEGMLSDQRDQLQLAMKNDKVLQEARFRGDTLHAVKKAAQ